VNSEKEVASGEEVTITQEEEEDLEVHSVAVTDNSEAGIDHLEVEIENLIDKLVMR
jgi:hypothetical protein